MESEKYESKQIEYIHEHGREIGEEARAGNELAKSVVQSFSLWFRCPLDACAEVFLEEAVNEYIAGKTDTLPS